MSSQPPVTTRNIWWEYDSYARDSLCYDWSSGDSYHVRYYLFIIGCISIFFVLFKILLSPIFLTTTFQGGLGKVPQPISMSKGGLEHVISHILVQHLNHGAKLVLKHASTVPHRPNILHRAILLCRYTFSHLPTNIASYLTAPHTPASFQSLLPCLVLTNSHQPSAKSPDSAFRCFIAVYHSAFLSLSWDEIHPQLLELRQAL